MPYPQLFEPLTLGTLQLPNRVIMSPLTRSRAASDGTPNDLMVEYYRQRASAGLIIAEATPISQRANGWSHAPGIYTDSHVSGWKKVTDAVHERGGLIVLQLWHTGRVSTAAQLGTQPVSASAIEPPPEVVAHTGDGSEESPVPTPRALRVDEMDRLIDDYRQAAQRAKDAGFDGVELHAANGYLMDQFLRTATNQRDDDYGGSAENRCRLPLQVVDGLCDVLGSSRVGVRVSPVGVYNAMSDDNPEETFTTFARELSQRNIAFIDVVEPANPFDPDRKGLQRPSVCDAVNEAFDGVYLANGGYDGESAQAILEANRADGVVFGRPYISNPDLVRRFRDGIDLVRSDAQTWYGARHGETGYTDYKTA